MSTGLPAPYAELVDDAAIFPPGNVALPEAVAAFLERSTEWHAGLVGPFVIATSASPT